MGFVRFPMSSARFRQVFLTGQANFARPTRSLQTVARVGQNKVQLLKHDVGKFQLIPMRSAATKDAICALCDWVTNHYGKVAVIGVLALAGFWYAGNREHMTHQWLWSGLSFVGREITFDDFVSKYLCQGEVVRVHHYTDNRVWVERAYEPDMRRWMNHFDKEIDREIEDFLTALKNTKAGDDEKKKAYMHQSGTAMKEVRYKRRMIRILKKIARILGRSPESTQKVAGLIDRMNKEISQRNEVIKKAVEQIETGEIHKPLTDVLARMATSEEMRRVFVEISEYEHVYFHVESREELVQKLDEAMAKCRLKPEKRVKIINHNTRSIEIAL